MEINITKFYNEACARDYAASTAEIGNNAGADTWRAACEDAPDYNLLSDGNKLDAMRKWVIETGAWSEKEVDDMDSNSLNALFIQLISGDIREKNEMDGVGMNWEEYQAASERGIVSGCLFEGTDGAIYYSLRD